MQVGPQSAGSVPGPVCYGTGGDRVTLTDALVALGYLNPDHLLGGDLALDAQRAASAIDEQVCTRLGRSRIEAAHGIYTIAVSNMMRAVKAVSTFRGRDPREFTLFAFGGQWARHRHGDRARARDAAGAGTAEPRGVQRAGVARFGA